MKLPEKPKLNTAIGSKVFSTVSGWGKVAGMYDTLDGQLLAVVQFRLGERRYNESGNSGADIPGLFNSPQEAAEYFAKFKTTLKVERWINVYSDGSTSIYYTETDAYQGATSGRIACEHFCKEYEIQEGAL